MFGSGSYAGRSNVRNVHSPGLGRINIAVRVDNQTFVTARGDRISRPPGRRPQQGRLGGPYPQLDEVGEQSVHGF